MTSAEELLSALRSRRSVRRFTSDPVARETIERLIELAAWAPSAGNRQDWFFTVVTAPALKERMADVVRRRWDAIVSASKDSALGEELARYAATFAGFAAAPVVIAVSARKVSGFETRLMGEVAHAASGSYASAAMAAQNLMLAAHALGLGSCCMTGAVAARDEIAALLDLGRKHELVCLVAVGVPAETPRAPARKPVTEITRFLE
ncbi:MAG: nitroreductase family protein [Planctomycetota bacterium]|nr:nitroreductase family protein [Planctomycetota bacterium]